MSSRYDTYTSPLSERNASPEMLRIWSPRHKFNTWRRIWLAAAEAMHEVTAGPGKGDWPGSPLVTREQVEELRAVVRRPGGITDEEIARAERYERDLRHDVMAHVHALGDSCPKARGIIHLGMTSEDVGSNADLLILQESGLLVRTKLARTVLALCNLAGSHGATPALAFTHYQPAQPATVGRRAASWAQDLWVCHDRFEATTTQFPTDILRGLRGATGTQASFLALCNGESSAVDRLESSWIAKLYRNSSFEHDSAGVTLPLTGQTYPRVIDTFILADLASIACVLHKIATDIRLLCNRKELDEPFEDKQIGSSAMPYKRNPMRCERICGLARFVMNLVGNAYDTAATQWLERTLDDSSNRRLSLPEAFLALDGALDLMHNVAGGLVVHEAMVRKNLMAELPFLATENILMACVKLGGDRQEYHEKIRVHAQAAGLRVKQEGLDNDLLERLRNDPAFWSAARGGPLAGELDWDGLLDPMKYVGRSVEQTERFLQEVVEPLRAQHAEAIAGLGTSGPRV
ncbi:MAG TPA: adenylosuccinate lyase [Phycisphaerales bacterium]|nr:adenylosuccinate lyase [Phycisphaerales bacterium]